MKIKEYSLRKNQRGGIRTYHAVLSPQTRAYNAHHHTECELSVFLAGSGSYTVGKRVYPFRAGDVFLFASDEEHCITEVTEQMDLLNVQFEPYLLWEDPDAAELLALFNARSRDFENRFADADGAIRALLLALEDELCRERPCRAVTARYRLFLALVTLIRDYGRVDHERAVRATDNVAQSIRAAMEYVQHNLERPLTLREIAAAACLSPTYFSHVFKQFNGISLWKYINIKRVERAIEMLKAGGRTKLEIAELCGFSAPSNFYKTFAAVTGKTPGDYAREK